MREVTQNMIKKYLLLEKKYDFMGYHFVNKEELSFHHLVVAKSKCDEYGILGGYYEWNGAVLVRHSAHNYLHLIERIDKKTFLEITDVLIDENLKGHLDRKNLKEIHKLLCYFENCYGNEKLPSGEPLIKKEYYKRLIKKNEL